MVAAETQAPVTVETLAQSLASSCWYRRTVSEGTKGPIEYAFARKRVTLSKAGLPDRTAWLVLKRTLGAEPTYWYYLSNAPESTPLPCSMAHRTPLSHTNKRNGVLSGALLR